MASLSAVESIFQAALEKGSAEERAAFLDQACQGDSELRQQVERLLNAEHQLGSFLEQPAAAGGATSDVAHSPWTDPAALPRLTEVPGSRIGPYKLLQQIGEGGMGVVYMVEQEQPVRRKVALKIIKPGMDSRQVIARFEAERQALALMDHQNIARVLDVGTTETGRPYFVMELVKGVPITKFCDEQHLTPRERLELFVPVCEAIQHAHQKGIIHRDIKPSNVLVTLYDGKPVPKVIDFGVAKATEQRLTERTLFTQLGQVVGTLEYMSPEQAELNALDIDTRSDIYSLGVLLYELLTGSTPMEKHKVRGAGFSDMLRMIREEEPPRPSTRLSASRDQLPAISAQRKTEPAKLAKLVRGELDWIVMKALEKDRGRRYETANGFARDIQRYLADETVEACPPSAGYRLRKFARKNRKPLATAGVFVLLLVVAAAISAWQAIRATQAETKARQAQSLAEERFDLARQAVDKYLNEVTEDPELKGANFEKLRKRLLETAVPFFQKLAEQAPGDAEREAAMGLAYFRLASLRVDMGQRTAAAQDYARVRDIFARLADEHPDVPDYRSHLAESHTRLGEMCFPDRETEAVAEFRTAIKFHRTAIKLQQRLADERPDIPDYRQRLAGSHQGLGEVLQSQSKRVEAEAHYRLAIEGFRRLADEHPDVPMYRSRLARSRTSLANLLFNHGKKAEAEAECRAALKEQQRLTNEDPNVPMYRFELAENRKSLGEMRSDAGMSSEAQAEYRAAIKEYRRLADEHPNVPDYRIGLGCCHHQLGMELAAMGKQTEAECELRAAIREQRLVQEHPPDAENRDHLAVDHQVLGHLLADWGRREEAEAEYRAALKFGQRLTDDHPNVSKYRDFLAGARFEFGDLLVHQGKWMEAEREYRAALKEYERLAEQHANDPKYRSDLASTYNQWAWMLATCLDLKLRDPGQALAHARKAVELAPSSGTIWNTLGVVQYRNGDWAGAIKALMKATQLGKGGNSLDFFFLAMAHWKLNEKEKARAWYDRAVAWMDKNSPKNEELKRFRVEAAALLGLAKAAEAQNKKE
jgi:serine/threonine protein kinase/tetratricopeptide (TPR) repeat protein